jgi:carbonic anhydrase
MEAAFDDLLAANQRYANSAPRNFDGYAHAGVAVVTCMDSRLQPLEMIGLYLGEAKILRTPGGHVTPDALSGCILGVHLLHVNRILVIAHTRCAMASSTDSEIADRIHTQTGLPVDDIQFGADPDQLAHLRADVQLLASHPLIAGRASVGGFRYDVDSGLLEQLC